MPDHLADARDLLEFIDACPSPYHAVDHAADLLRSAGFRALDETAAWDPSPGGAFVVRGGSLVAWLPGTDPDPAAPFRIVGAHTDSPNLRVRPNPDTGSAGFRQLGLEVYGGALWNSWLDRDLGLSGRVALRGRAEPLLMRVDRALLRIPQLAIHLDRGVNEHGLQLNAQQHLRPIWSLGPPDEGGFRRFLADELGTGPDDVVWWDLMTHDVTPSCLLGLDDELLSAPRIDNLASCWATVRALEQVGDGTRPATAMVCLFDHEEVGSQSATGADGTVLATTLERVVLGRGGGRAEMLRALAGSVCVSADGAHATHPNYPDRHEADHRIHLNAGPVVKVNSNHRYATDARSAGVAIEACERAGVPHQRFVVRGDMDCGSTIGPVTAARLGVPTVDLGLPQLAMHSARETCGSADPALLRAALGAFLGG